MNIDLIIMILALAVVIFAIIAFYFILKSIKQQQLEPKIIELITEAENKFEVGEVKFDYVFDKLYNTFAPKIVRLLFSADEIKKIIQYVFDKVKIALDYRGE